MRKFLVLGILFGLFMAGLGFGQNANSTQEQNQPVPAPYLVLFGTQWDQCGYGGTYAIKDLGIEIGVVFLRDRNNVLGIIDLIVIVKDNKTIPLAGWLKSFTSEEQGFIIEDPTIDKPILTKTRAEGETMIFKSGKDQNGDPVIVFFLLKKEFDPATNEEVIKREALKFIDIKKFVEENFKDPGK